MALDTLAVLTNEATEGIDARELHQALGIGRDFSTWIHEQIARFGFVEGSDFSPLSGKSHGGRPAVEYALSLAAAKLIALSQNSEAGKAARAALVKIEAAWNSPTAIMARAVQMANAELSRLRHEQEQSFALIAQLRPKAAAHDRLSAAKGDQNLRDVAKILGRQPNLFHADLISDRILYYSRYGKAVPYQEWLTAGYFHVRVVERNGMAFDQTLVTPKGIQWLAGRYPPVQALIPAGQEAIQ